MNEYLNETKKHLKNVPLQEQEELIQYYEEYLNDAELSTEEVVKQYGTPKEFAKKIEMTYLMSKDGEEDGEEPIKETVKQRLNLVWLIILGLFGVPVLIPLGLAMIVLVLAVVLTLFLLWLSAYVFVGAFFLGAVIALVASFTSLFTSPATAVAMFGMFLLSGGIGVLIAPLIQKVTKWLFAGFNKFVNMMKQMNKERIKNSMIDLGGKIG